MKFSFTTLLSLSTAAAVEVDAMSALANVAVMLDSMYTPLETTASTIKTFVEAGSSHERRAGREAPSTLVIWSCQLEV